MIDRRTLLLTLSLLALAAGTGWASTATPFTVDAFHAAQTAGRPILVDIAASWCPTCKAQALIIRNLTSQDAYKDIVVFQVDFDNQQDVVNQFGARMQSTLIVFKGTAELARSVGSTDPHDIETLLAKTTGGS